MGLYGNVIGPRLINAVCGLGSVTEQRRKVVPLAEGVVVEIGFGKGHNLPLYDPARVETLFAVNPPDGFARHTRMAADTARLDVRVVEEGAEALSLDSGMADTVVVTYALCSIPEPERAVGEMRRILKPGGRLLFCEHGRAGSEAARRWQTRLEPAWKRIGLGCHLTREPVRLLAAGGFRIEMIDEGPPPGTIETLEYHYIGAAHPA